MLRPSDLPTSRDIPPDIGDPYLAQQTAEVFAVIENETVLLGQIPSGLREGRSRDENALLCLVMHGSHADECLNIAGPDAISGRVTFALHDQATARPVGAPYVGREIAGLARSLHRTVPHAPEEGGYSFFELRRCQGEEVFEMADSAATPSHKPPYQSDRHRQQDGVQHQRKGFGLHESQSPTVRTLPWVKVVWYLQTVTDGFLRSHGCRRGRKKPRSL